jgi:methionine-rich copper-binding protein CopC
MKPARASRRRARCGPAAAWAIGVLLAAVAGLLSTGTASAHDVLVSTNPADKTTVGSTPAQVILTFDKPALKFGTLCKVTGPSGDVTDGSPELVDNQVRQAITPGAPAGAYTVAWRVTSADGHPVSGTFTFTSTKAGPGHPASPGSSPTPAPAAANPTRGSADSGMPWLWGLLAVVGLSAVGVFFALRVRRRQSHASGGTE